MNDSVDYLIVGQGLAGSLMGYLLLKAGKSVKIIDNNHSKAASNVAAGILNPITGRRFVKSWKTDDLFPFAMNFYSELEKEFNTKFLFPKAIIRTIKDIKTENDWMAKMGEEGIREYVIAFDSEDELQNTYKNYRSLAVFKNGGKCHIKEVVRTLKNFFIRKEALLNEALDYSKIQIEENSVTYSGERYERVLFCEGFQAVNNPWFGYLPFQPAKGEVLLVRIPGYKWQDYLIKNDVFVVPWEDELYWVGSNYQNNYENDLPTKEEKIKLIARLEASLTVPYEIVEHIAAVRPGVRGRRPLLGCHPDEKCLFIFNGLGTKGASLGPYFAQEMLDYLEGGAILTEEADIQRFESFYENNNV